MPHCVHLPEYCMVFTHHLQNMWPHVKNIPSFHAYELERIVHVKFTDIVAESFSGSFSAVMTRYRALISIRSTWESPEIIMSRACSNCGCV